MTDQYVVPVLRELTPAERALLAALIAHHPDGDKFMSQITRARVVALCSCGCPTIDLALDDDTVRVVGPSKVIADVEATSPEGHRVGVTLHVRTHERTHEDQLSELELIPSAEIETFGLPTPDAVDWSSNVTGG